jgi:hypothetical protein
VAHIARHDRHQAGAGHLRAAVDGDLELALDHLMLGEWK